MLEIKDFIIKTSDLLMSVNFAPVLGILLLIFASFALGFWGYEKIKVMKISQTTAFIFDKRFYKTPLRWVVLFIFWVGSFFNQKYKLYFLEAVKGEYDYLLFDKSFLGYAANEKYYGFSLVIANTVNYFQKVRHEKIQSKIRRTPYSSFLGSVSLHCDAYKMTGDDSFESRLKSFHRARYDLNKTLPKGLEKLFTQEERVRIQKRELKNKMEEEHKQLELLRGGLENVFIETRSVTKKASSRFDSI